MGSTSTKLIEGISDMNPWLRRVFAPTTGKKVYAAELLRDVARKSGFVGLEPYIDKGYLYHVCLLMMHVQPMHPAYDALMKRLCELDLASDASAAESVEQWRTRLHISVPFTSKDDVVSAFLLVRTSSNGLV